MRIAALMLVTAFASVGCAQESKAPPVSVSSGGMEKEPEPANSLPRGSAVDEPLTGQVGNIGTTRVGPAVRGGGTVPGRAY